MNSLEAEAAAPSRGGEAADVTELILQDILAGRLPPGTWLKQIDLERRYSCTRPQVRRALDRLVQKRLVEHIPNRGYHVPEQDGRRAQEVSDIRVILEVASVGETREWVEHRELMQHAPEQELVTLGILAKIGAHGTHKCGECQHSRESDCLARIRNVEHE